MRTAMAGWSPGKDCDQPSPDAAASRYWLSPASPGNPLNPNQETFMTKPTEIARLQAAWRTAATRPEGLTIPCPDLATARNIRFKLYNAVKPVRDGTWAGDAALIEAVDAMKISVRAQPPAVVIDRKPSMTLIDAALAAVGVDPEAAQEPTTAELAGSLERVLANVASAQTAETGKAEKLSELWPESSQTPTPAVNPFFTREPRDAER